MWGEDAKEEKGKVEVRLKASSSRIENFVNKGDNAFQQKERVGGQKRIISKGRKTTGTVT